jgi:hypothetical protein
MPKSTPDFSSIDEKLATLLNLNAYLIAKGMTIAQGAPILKRLGLSASEIAAVFDSTPATVNVRLAEAKKKGRGTKHAKRTQKGRVTKRKAAAKKNKKTR